MRCLIVDDHPLTREGTAIAVRAVRPTIEILEAGCLREALGLLAPQSDVDLVLLDLDLGDSSGIESLTAVKQHLDDIELDARVVVLSGIANVDLVQQVINSYGTGFILKATPRVIFEQAIALTLAGGVYIPEVILRQFKTSGQQEKAVQRGARCAFFTVRESEVAALLIRGLTYKRIARELERVDGRPISEHTVRAHVGNLAWKLGVSENAKAGVMAEIARRGLVFPAAR